MLVMNESQVVDSMFQVLDVQLKTKQTACRVRIKSTSETKSLVSSLD